MSGISLDREASPEKYAETLISILKNPEKYRQLGEEARHRVEQKPSRLRQSAGSRLYRPLEVSGFQGMWWRFQQFRFACDEIVYGSLSG